MKKYFIPLIFFCVCVNAHAVPNNSMSITPVATSGQTITASDENTRNNEVQNKFNAHTHTDIDQVSNTLKLGDGNSGNKTIQANNTDSNLPFLRFDDTNDIWVVSRDGTTTLSLVVMTGTDVSQSILPENPSDKTIMQFDADSNIDAWTPVTTLIDLTLTDPTLKDPDIDRPDIDGGTIDGVVLAGSTNQGDVWYDNGTQVTRLTPGTDGQFLRTQGASANPTWTFSGRLLESTTTITGTTTSITVAADNLYELVMNVKANGSGGTSIFIRFNTDTTSTVYSWSFNDISHAVSPTDTVSGDNSDSEIQISGALGTSSWGHFQLYFTNPDTADDTIWHVFGNGTYFDGSTGQKSEFSGRYNGGSAVTSIDIVASGGDNTATGTAYLYKISKQ